MEKMTKRFFSLLLALVMVISVVPVFANAAPVDLETKLESAEDDYVVITPDVKEYDLSGFSFASVLAPTLLSAEDVVIDKTNPEILSLEAVLADMKVLGADGDPVPLTAEQKATLVALYQQYVDHRNANADVLGVQVPFYLQYNDNADELGVLGEVLSLANIPLEAVRAGMVPYSDLEGMMVIFLFTDQLGIQFYGDAIKAARDEVLQLIKDSGAQTEVQKQLVLNDWLAEVCNFDMPYIMGEDTMKAQNPQKHRYYDTVYGIMYDMYEESIGQTFVDNIKNGLKAEMQKQFYIAAIQQGVYDSAYSFDPDATYEAAYEEAYDLESMIEAEEKKVYDEAYAAKEKEIYDAAYQDAFDNYAVSDNQAYNNAYDAALAEFKAGQAYTDAYEAAAAEYEDSDDRDTLFNSAYATARQAYLSAEEGELYTERMQKYNDAYDAYIEENAADPENPTPEEIAAAQEAANAAVTEAAQAYAKAQAEAEVAAAADTYAKGVADEAADTYAKAAAEAAVETAKEDASKAAAEQAVRDQKGNIEAAAEAAVLIAEEEIEAAAEAKADEIATAAAEQAVEEGQAAAEAAANGAVEGFMAQNGAAVEADPVAFMASFGEEAANDTAQAWEAFWADCEANGIPGMVDTFAAEIWKAVIEQFYVQGMTQQGLDEATAKAQAAAIMEQDAEAIAADPYAYCVEKFEEEGAAQAQAVVNSELAKMGIDGSKETNPEGRVSLDVIVALQMDTPQEDPMLQLPDGSYMTPNQAIPVFAEQAAPASTQGVLDFWEGSHFGALGEGKAVCLGYADAYAYMVQCMHPEYYTKTGNYKTASDWKTDVNELYYTNGQLDINKGYFADLVRISFATEVTMFGQVQEEFNNDHFWNAARIDGTWYYVDPCYTDVFVEVMMRDRAETDGNVNHMYYMFSHDSALSLYDGYYSELKTLYANAANSTSYEDSWTARIVSDTSYDDGYAYYVYSSCDLISMLNDFNNNNNMESDYNSEYEFKLVRHKMDTSDVGDGDTDYEALIEFNHLVNEETEETVSRVYNPSTGEMEDNAFLTALYEQHKADTQIYPSLCITCALDGDLLYFNLSNYLLAYDLTTGDVIVVKEYTTVGAVRDKTNAFGAMAFSVTTGNADLTVENHPIAGIILKEDGNLYVSVATNFSFISGKETNDKTHATPDDPAARGDYGYEYEESNYNPNYSTYGSEDYDDGMYEQFGYEKEINDNDEFMWTANFVEKQSMSNVAVNPCSEHTYEAVEVEANCEHNAYTVNICEDCGAVENGTYVEEADTIHNHHYIYFAETYYTKDENNENWNTGECYVCAECGFSIEEPTEPQENGGYGDYGTSYEEQYAQYEKELAVWNNAVETAGHEYSVLDASWSEDNSTVTFSRLRCEHCNTRKPVLDCLLKDNNISITLSSALTAETTIDGYSGDCTTGAVATYAAAGPLKGFGTYYVSKDVELDAGSHAYEIDAIWNLVEDADGNAVLDADGNQQFTVDATLTCAICGHTYTAEDVAATLDTENSQAPACEEAGSKVYTATVTATDNAGTAIGSATATHAVEIPATGHDFEDGICTVCGVAEKFDLYGANMTLGNSLAMNFFIETADLREGESYYAIITKSYADGEDEPFRVDQADWGTLTVNNVPMHYATLNVVAAKEMTDDVKVVIYNSKDEVVSNVYTDSVRAYTMRALEKEEAAEAPNEAKLTMYVDMLNYGAAAQVRFEYDVNDLANSQLTAAQKEYATDSVSAVNKQEKGEGFVGTNLSLESDLLMNFFFNNIPDNHNDMYAMATFTNHYGNDVVVRIEGKDFGQLNNDSKWYVPVKGVVIADCSQLVTVKVYNASGTVIASGVDSIESYIARAMDKDPQLYEAIMKFAVSAREALRRD